MSSAPHSTDLSRVRAQSTPDCARDQGFPTERDGEGSVLMQGMVWKDLRATLRPVSDESGWRGAGKKRLGWAWPSWSGVSAEYLAHSRSLISDSPSFLGFTCLFSGTASTPPKPRDGPRGYQEVQVTMTEGQRAHAVPSTVPDTRPGTLLTGLLPHHDGHRRWVVVVIPQFTDEKAEANGGGQSSAAVYYPTTVANKAQNQETESSRL